MSLKFDINRIKESDITEFLKFDSKIFYDKNPWTSEDFNFYIKGQTWSQIIRYNGEIYGILIVGNNCGSYYIVNLSVLETYRNNGLATLMMKNFAKFLDIDDKYSKVTLNVLASNHIAFDFYKRIGFELTKKSRQEDYRYTMEIEVDKFKNYFLN